MMIPHTVHPSNYRRATLLLLTLLLVLPTTLAQVWQEGIRERERLQSRLQEQFFTVNPAATHLRYRHNLSQFDLSVDYRQESAIRLHEIGQGHTLYRASASSYIRLSPTNVVQGFARYTNGVKRAISWNSVTDYEKLYPFAVADSKGGDLRHEEYHFGGSYTRVMGRYSGGTEMNYRALQDYRGFDPRPRSITSDFRLILGGGVLLADSSYLLTASLSHTIYKQLASVDIYSHKGGPPQRLLDGLGSSLRRFDTVEPSLYYRGHGTMGAMSLLPHSGSGLSVRTAYHYGTLVRILSGKNETPTNHYIQHRMEGTIGYLSQDKRWGVTLDLSHLLRTGYDHIIGDPYGGSYPILATRRSNIISRTLASISGGMEWGETLRLLLQPTISYDRLQISQAVPRQSIGISRLAYLVPVTLRAGGWQIALSAQYSHAPRHRLSLARGETLAIHVEHIEQSYRHLSDEALTLGIGSGYTLPLGSDTALRIRLDYRHTTYRSAVHGHRLIATSTLIF